MNSFARYVSCDVVVYYDSLMLSELGYGLYFFGNGYLDDSSNFWYIPVQGFPFDDSTYFYGLSELTKTSSSNSPFDF